MTRDSIEEIKNKLDVKDVVGGYVKLEKSGVNWRARCPLHNEKTPSFFVSPARQVWRCFGCGEGGDIFTFVEHMEGVEFSEALRLLAQKAGVRLERQDPRIRSEKNKSLEIYTLTTKYFRHQLESKNGALVLAYLKERGISEETAEHFGIGYAPLRGTSLVSFLVSRGFGGEDIVKAGLAFRSDTTGEYISRFRGRIMFPIANISGDVVGFGGRVLAEDLAQKMGRTIPADSAKYINTPQTHLYDKSNILYGLDKAKIPIRQNDACVIVEGYTDVILAHQAGYKNVVAASGTALTEQQLKLLSRFTENLLTCFDMDIAGDNATRRGIDLAQAVGFNVKVVTLEQGLDPADVIGKKPKQWEASIEDAQSVTAFYFSSAFAKYDATQAEGKRAIGMLLAPVIKNIPSRIEQAHWVQQLASRTRVREEDVWEDVKNAKESIERRSLSGEKNPGTRKIATRKELVLQQAVLHLIKEPKLVPVVREALSDVSEHGTIIKLLRTLSEKEDTGSLDTQLKTLSNEENLFVNQLLLEADVRPDTEYSEQSLGLLLTLYKKLLLEEELQELEQTIRANELSGKTEENQKLLQEFHTKSARKANLI